MAISFWVSVANDVRVKMSESCLKRERVSIAGGAPDIQTLTGGRYLNGFQGCIHIVEANHGKPTDLGLAAVSAANVETCPK